MAVMLGELAWPPDRPRFQVRWRGKPVLTDEPPGLLWWIPWPATYAQPSVSVYTPAGTLWINIGVDGTTRTFVYTGGTGTGTAP